MKYVNPNNDVGETVTVGVPVAGKSSVQSVATCIPSTIRFCEVLNWRRAIASTLAKSPVVSVNGPIVGIDGSLVGN